MRPMNSCSLPRRASSSLAFAVAFALLAAACGGEVPKSVDTPIGVTPPAAPSAPTTVVVTPIDPDASAPVPTTPAPSASSSSSVPGTEPVTPSPVGPPKKGKSYSLVASFYSPGNGTDHAAYDRLVRVVAEVGAAKVGHVSGHWGKEGEHDECFDLASLPPGEKKAFIERVRLAASSNRVRLSENATCKSERD